MRVEVRAVILDRGGLLVVSQRRAGAHSHYTLPGGRVRREESVTDALRREVQDELRFEIEPAQLLYVAEVARPHGEQDLDLVFLAHPAGLDAGGAPELVDLVAPDHAPARLVDLASPEDLPVLPPIVADIARDYEQGWSRTPRWLGNVWVPLPVAVDGAPV
jgi:ADP-ribose pyrophosphatase YjhB (NUDIX family)